MSASTPARVDPVLSPVLNPTLARVATLALVLLIALCRVGIVARSRAPGGLLSGV